MARTYRVKAVWKTLQGEGLFAGRPAVFVRFVGCNMWSGKEEDRARDAARTGAHCPTWCDTDFTREGSRSLSATALAAQMTEIGGAVRFCVLTGGEPLLQIDAPLIRALHASGFQVAVETNGTVSMSDRLADAPPDWVVCSPKLPPERLVLEWFDELKLVVPDYAPATYDEFARRARSHEVGGSELPLLWLQPEDGPRFRSAVDFAVSEALADPRWRVSVQTHKILDVE